MLNKNRTVLFKVNERIYIQIGFLLFELLIFNHQVVFLPAAIVISYITSLGAFFCDRDRMFSVRENKLDMSSQAVATKITSHDHGKFRCYYYKICAP